MKAAVIHWHRGAAGERVARLKLTQGDRHEWLDVCVPATMPLPHKGAVEEWVADLALMFPTADRIDELARRSPLVWGEDRLSA